MVFGKESIEVELPDGSGCLSMSQPIPLSDPRQAIIIRKGDPDHVYPENSPLPFSSFVGAGRAGMEDYCDKREAPHGRQ